MTTHQNPANGFRSFQNRFPSQPQSSAHIPKFTQQVQAKAARQGVYLPQHYTTNLLLFLSCAIRPDLVGQPRMFLIEGEPGTGKTYTTRRLLDTAGFHVVDLEMSMLERANAGEPAEYVVKKIHEASTHIEEHGPAVIMADDLDLLISENTESSTGTRNTLQLTATLQRHCDDPTQLLGQSCHPVPILATLNDTSVARESLSRGGRAQRYHFNPEGADLFKMACAILQPLVQEDHLKWILQSAKGWRIAQFRDLATRIEHLRLMEQYSNMSLKQLMDRNTPHPSRTDSQKPSREVLASCMRGVEAGRKRTSYLD